MTRLFTHSEPLEDEQPTGAPAGGARVTSLAQKQVGDVSSDSLAAFSSEHELATARRPLPARQPPAGLPAPQPTERAAVRRPPARPAEQPLVASPAPAAARRLTALLSVLVIVQAAMIAWWWRESGVRTPPAPVAAAVTVTSEPAGAAVSIDGVRRGETPLAVELAAGTHEVGVATGAASWTRTLDVKGGQPASIHVVQPTPPALTAPVSPEGGALEITTEPPGLLVAVDGAARGVSPISITDLDPGAHEIAVTRGGSVVRRTVSVEAGVPTAVLISTSSPGIASGWLTVTGPVPVQIVENGTLLGTSDAPRLLLPVGTHDLEFVSEPFGYRGRRTVQITSGQAAAVALEPVDGTLSVNALPWGEVWIDGRRIGETPIGNLPLAIGNHDIVVRHPQLGERRRTVAVGATAPVRVGIDLRQP